jgi:hypothetical protein
MAAAQDGTTIIGATIGAGSGELAQSAESPSTGQDAVNGGRCWPSHSSPGSST